MLVLSSQRDETIMIGDDIEVTVVDIRGDKVRLGINAPKEISVHRKEVTTPSAARTVRPRRSSPRICRVSERSVRRRARVSRRKTKPK